jgi:hypothetical protein
MNDLCTGEPPLPLTGFALFLNDRLLLQGGTPTQLRFCQPDQLSPEAYKQLLWLLEAALGAQRNDLIQTDPGSIRSLLRVLTLCHADRPRDPYTGAVLAHGIPLLTADHAEHQPSGGSFCQPMAGLLPRPALPARTHPADLGCVGGISGAGRPQSP